jgi:hypothetical protein
MQDVTVERFLNNNFINKNDNSSLERVIARDFRFVYKNLVSFGLLIYYYYCIIIIIYYYIIYGMLIPCWKGL